MQSKPQKERLETLFEAFNERNIRYVILRGHPELSTSGSGSDIDTYVSPYSYDSAVDICQQLGFSDTESNIGNALGLVARGIRKPRLAIQLFAESPQKFVSILREGVATDIATYQGYREREFEDDTFDVHLVNHLAYRSPLDNQKVRIDPAVEQQLIDYRHKSGSVYIPAPPDELAHLVCRGVFDYEGQFPRYYVDRCDYLVEKILDSQPAAARFQELLQYLFYEADSLVYELVIDRQYNEIRSRLYRYSDY